MSLRLSEKYLWALSVMHVNISLASNVNNELVAGWCITERVKRLAGNKIKLGMMIPVDTRFWHGHESGFVCKS